jgi:Lar family restriction alleviation protein
MKDLKPCPFCGSHNIDLLDYENRIADNGHWTIRCYSCNVEMSEAYLLGNYGKGDKEPMLTHIKSKWNRRHEVRRHTPHSYKECCND